MVNNFQKIQDLLVFDSEDDFYHLQIIKRKKEHPELGSNSYVVKTYYITSLEYLFKKSEEIKALCNHHNARACINLNRRSFEKISYHLLRKVTEQILNRDFRAVRKAYESVCGAHSNEPVKKWIIDVDGKKFDNDPEWFYALRRTLVGIEPTGDKWLDVIESKNGCHIITRPFNVEVFKKTYPGFDIHKDNPTILFVP
jgi:hypothetical protein